MILSWKCGLQAPLWEVSWNGHSVLWVVVCWTAVVVIYTVSADRCCLVELINFFGWGFMDQIAILMPSRVPGWMLRIYGPEVACPCLSSYDNASPCQQLFMIKMFIRFFPFQGLKPCSMTQCTNGYNGNWMLRRQKEMPTGCMSWKRGAQDRRASCSRLHEPFHCHERWWVFDCFRLRKELVNSVIQEIQHDLLVANDRRG